MAESIATLSGVIKYLLQNHMPEPVKNTKSNTQVTHRVSVADLPLHCPVPNSPLWNSHPRVYLPLDRTNKIRCPYCGTMFILEETP
ncbi:MAG: zinc-finger domain-containing protein [Candidatus Porifericomitaceae bacterium WSBS_2022_MAG_OTU9]